MDWTIIILRVLHVGGGLFWAGAGLTMGLFVQPTAQAQGRAGGELMQRLMGESGLGRAMGISAIAALGSGIALYWIDYGEVVPFNASMAAFAVGGLAALIVWLATVTISLPAGRQMTALAEQAGRGEDVGGEMARLGSRLRRTGQVSMWLMIVTIVSMAIARYLT
jgi:hypothetical protein